LVESEFICTLCLKKVLQVWLAVTSTHEQILIIFGRRVTYKVLNQKIYVWNGWR